MVSQAIRCFLVVARIGSFRRTAESLHVSASAINRQITLLETSLGTALFERSRGRNRLRLTPAGQIVLRHARAASIAIEQAKAELEALKGLRIGTIALGAPETFAHDFLPDFLCRFHQTHPGISFRISVALQRELVEQLVRDDVEVAMIYDPPARAAVRVVAQIEKPMCVMVRRDHPLARRSAVRLEECGPYPLVMPEYGTRARAQYDTMLGSAGIEPTWIVTTTSYQMLRSMVHAGLGAAIVSDYIMSRNRHPDVVFVPIRDCAPSVLACCIRGGRDPSVAAAAFVEEVGRLFDTLKKRKPARKK